jgi:predicted ATPase
MIRGVYLCGGVGSGKSALMDDFYESLKAGGGAAGPSGDDHTSGAAALPAVRRMHWHEFIRDTHARLHADFLQGGERVGQGSRRGGGGALRRLGAAMARESPVLCFDEVVTVNKGLWKTKLFNPPAPAARLNTKQRMRCL